MYAKAKKKTKKYCGLELMSGISTVCQNRSSDLFLYGSVYTNAFTQKLMHRKPFILPPYLVI